MHAPVTAIPIKQIHKQTHPLPTSQTREPAKSRPQRIVFLDAMRVIAGMAVIWVHSIKSPELSPGNILARFGTPFFSLVAVLMMIQHVRNRPDMHFAEYARHRFVRLYFPFIAWSLFYLGLRNIERLTLSERMAVEIQAALSWVGTADHLWFVPYILGICLLFFPIARWMAKNPGRLIPLAISAFAAGLFFALVQYPACLDDQPPTSMGLTHYMLRLAWMRAPCALWGISFAVMLHQGKDRIRCHKSMVFGLGLVVATIIAIALRGQNTLLENLTGVGLVFVAMAPVQNIIIDLLGRLGKYSFGIYLCHLAFVKGLLILAARVSPAPRWWIDLLVFGLSAIMAAGLSLALSKSTWTSWLVA